MRRFVLDSRGSAATGAPPYAMGIEWPDGFVTLRLRDELDGPHFVHCRSMAGFIEDSGATPRWLDPPAPEPCPECKGAGGFYEGGSDGPGVGWGGVRTCNACQGTKVKGGRIETR